MTLYDVKNDDDGDGYYVSNDNDNDNYNVKHSLLIGANQRTIRCNDFVVNEHIVPKMHKTSNASRTVW